jgi:hypothetical protein
MHNINSMGGGPTESQRTELQLFQESVLAHSLSRTCFSPLTSFCDFYDEDCTQQLKDTDAFVEADNPFDSNSHGDGLVFSDEIASVHAHRAMTLQSPIMPRSYT